MSVVYKITYPNGKVYIGQDRTNSINYLGSASWYRAKAHSVRAPRPTEARTDVREKLTSLAGRLQPPPAHGSLGHLTPSEFATMRSGPLRRPGMADDLKNRGPQDRSRVNVNEDWEVTYWCKEFGCSEAELRAAVAAVGVSVPAVRVHLGKKS